MGSSSFSSSSSFASDLEAGYAPPLPSPPREAMRSRSPRATLFCDGFDDDEPRHFLDICSLCRKPLSDNRDIFMYRGDMPFCSAECRQDQIDMDEGRSQNWKLSLKASSRKDANSASASAGVGAASPDAPPKSHKVHVSTGTAVAAG